MLKKRTKTEFAVPTSRGTIMAIVRLVIDGVFFDNNTISPKGYYYYLDENLSIIKLDALGTNAQKDWAIVAEVENNFLPDFSNARNLKENILQRLKEFTDLQMQQEIGENYNTTPEDWEDDI